MQLCLEHGTNDSGSKCSGRSSPQPESQGSDRGMSLSDYLLGELREIAERPTLAEFRERLHTRKPLPVALDTAGLVREERAAR
jgi:hypothetical protein